MADPTRLSRVSRGLVGVVSVGSDVDVDPLLLAGVGRRGGRFHVVVLEM